MDITVKNVANASGGAFTINQEYRCVQILVDGLVVIDDNNSFFLATFSDFEFVS